MRGSCAVGPWIVVGADEDDARQWSIQLEIRAASDRWCSRARHRPDRSSEPLPSSSSTCSDRSSFHDGVVLLTGAGIVPPDSFTLEAGDTVRITISGIGTLENPVSVV